jgi:hypothetical protein
MEINTALYEYKVINVWLLTHHHDHASLAKWLNILGEQGWRVKAGVQDLIILERPVRLDPAEMKKQPRRHKTKRKEK